MEEYVKVPISALKEVEEARVALYALLDRDGFFERSQFNTMYLTHVTQPIWHIANRKWEIVDESTPNVS